MSNETRKNKYLYNKSNSFLYQKSISIVIIEGCTDVGDLKLLKTFDVGDQNDLFSSQHQKLIANVFRLEHPLER